MPPTSEQLPLLGIYYTTTTCIVSLSTAMSVLTLHINNKGRRGHEVPKLVKKIFFNYIARVMHIKLDSVASRMIINNRLLYENKTLSDSRKPLINNMDSNNCINDLEDENKNCQNLKGEY